MRHDGIRLALLFTPTLKLQFLDELSKVWPNVYSACQATGITRQTYTAHLGVDECFRMRVQEVVDQKVDEVEGRFYEFGKKSRNFMDRMIIARAYRPEVYDPAKKIELTHRNEMTDHEAGEIIGRAKNFVDAEIVTEQFKGNPKLEDAGPVGLDLDEGKTNRKDVPNDA